MVLDGGVPPENDPLFELRKDIVGQFQPLILSALGLTEANVPDEPYQLAFLQDDGVLVLCSAERFIDSSLFCSVTEQVDTVMPDFEVIIRTRVKREFNGESGIIKEVVYEAFTLDMQVLSEEALNIKFGEPMRPLGTFSDELGVFDDLPIVKYRLESLNPRDGFTSESNK